MTFLQTIFLFSWERSKNFQLGYFGGGTIGIARDSKKFILWANSFIVFVLKTVMDPHGEVKITVAAWCSQVLKIASSLIDLCTHLVMVFLLNL